jgi:hypothetical protein
MKFFVALAMISTVAAQRTITVGVLYSCGSELTYRPCTSGLQRVPVHDVVIYVDYQCFSNQNFLSGRRYDAHNMVGHTGDH